MKKLIIGLIVFASSLASFAQEFNNEVEIYQAIYGLEKTTIVEKVINIEKTDQEVFWKLYNEYEGKRKDLGQQRIELIADYAANYNDLSDEKMNELVNKSAKLQADLSKIILDYYNKINKQTNTKVAAQFFQLEHYFLTATRSVISEQIPFIDELNSTN